MHELIVSTFNQHFGMNNVLHFSKNYKLQIWNLPRASWHAVHWQIVVDQLSTSITFELSTAVMSRRMMFARLVKEMIDDLKL
jgi:hypothetical protein